MDQQTNANLTTVIDKFERIRQKFDRERAWVTCPACSEEWTKLHPCRIGSSWNYVCVQCAESFKSWDWIVKTYPIPKPFENWSDDWIETYAYWPKDLPRVGRCGNEDVPLYGNKSAIVKIWEGRRSSNAHPKYTWRLYPGNMEILMYDENGFVGKFNTTLETWFNIAKRIEKFEPPEDTKTWNFKMLR